MTTPQLVSPSSLTAVSVPRQVPDDVFTLPVALMEDMQPRQLLPAPKLTIMVPVPALASLAPKRLKVTLLLRMLLGTQRVCSPLLHLVGMFASLRLHGPPDRPTEIVVTINMSMKKNIRKIEKMTPPCPLPPPCAWSLFTVHDAFECSFGQPPENGQQSPPWGPTLSPLNVTPHGFP